MNRVPLPLFEKRIGEGRYRIVYRDGETAVKILKPVVEKRYGSMTVRFPARLYTTLKFGIPDFNAFEYRTFLRIQEYLPDELQPHVAAVHGVERYGTASVSRNDIVTNADGQVSRPLSAYGRIADPGFWKQLARLEEFFLDTNIFPFDIGPEKVVVQEQDRAIPVLISYKRFGPRTYPFQLNLQLRSQQVRKVRRRFARLRDVHA